MTNFLIRRFVPGADQVRSPDVRERYGLLAGVVGIFCNLLLCLAKLAVGTMTHSISVTADAINNLSDSLSSLISIVGFKLAMKEPDAKHPFGYGRTEYIAGFLVSFLILQVGYEFLKSSVSHVLHPQAVHFSGIGLLLLGATMLVKLWLGAFNRKIGRAIQSTTLLAAMQDSINDVITTMVVMLGIIASRFTALPVDGYIGIVVALFILWAGIGIARDTLGLLLGEKMDPELVKQLKKIVCGMDGIVGVHDLIIHNYGAGKSLASLHAEVPDDSDFVHVHEVIDDAEKKVYRETGVYLVIHMDPISVNDARVDALRDMVSRVLAQIDKRLTMHDFRIVDGKSHINLIFDVVVPFDYKSEDRDALRHRIETDIKKEDPRYCMVVTFDHRMSD